MIMNQVALSQNKLVMGYYQAVIAGDGGRQILAELHALDTKGHFHPG